MNENLNLAEILAGAQPGTMLYCTMYGDVELEKVDSDSDNSDYPIYIRSLKGDICRLTAEGRYLKDTPEGECLLFPSRSKRDWSDFVIEAAVTVTLHPFDQVLVRDREDEDHVWMATILSHVADDDDKYRYCTSAGWYSMCIPYNASTHQLVGTGNPCQTRYRIEFCSAQRIDSSQLLGNRIIVYSNESNDITQKVYEQ